jgi:MFS family permease
VLINFYHVPSNKVPIYGLAFSIGNLCGPLILGPLFDSWGRKQMIAGTYLVSGVLLGLSAVMFDAGVLDALTQTLMWVIIFFFASAGASAAYLTVSETWPIEIRAEAIAVFFAIGSIAGALGPAFYGALIGTGTSRTPLFWGYLIGAGIMVTGGLVEAFLGVQAAGKSLEQVTKPITAVDDKAAVPATATPAAPARPATA